MAINVLGAGAQFQLFQTGVYTALANITAIGGPDVEVDDVDVTNLSYADLFRRFIAGWADAGVVEMEANFDPATCATLVAQLRVANVWRIVFSNGSHWDFSGYLKSLKTDNPLTEQVSMPFSVKISGPPTFTQ